MFLYGYVYGDGDGMVKDVPADGHALKIGAVHGTSYGCMEKPSK